MSRKCSKSAPPEHEAARSHFGHQYLDQFYHPKKLATLVEWATDSDLTIWTSPVLMAELEDVLNRKKFVRYLDQPISAYLDFHQNLARIFKTEPVFDKSPDPKDNFLFDLAIQTGAALLVTGDKRLLEISPIDEVEVCSLADFRNRMEN